MSFDWDVFIVVVLVLLPLGLTLWTLREGRRLERRPAPGGGGILVVVDIVVALICLVCWSVITVMEFVGRTVGVLRAAMIRVLTARRFEVLLAPEDRYGVELVTDHGRVTQFAVWYDAYLQDAWLTIIRLNNHGFYAIVRDLEETMTSALDQLRARRDMWRKLKLYERRLHMAGYPIVGDNSDYAAEFLRYLVAHPEEADRIPGGALVVFAPEQRDPGLSAHNREAVQSAEAYRDKTPLFVTVRASQEVGKRYEFVFA